MITSTIASVKPARGRLENLLHKVKTMDMKSLERSLEAKKRYEFHERTLTTTTDDEEKYAENTEKREVKESSH
ncbi:hypothetical protein LOAG_12161 [Loa loa]|uniref:Ovule protein n=1 Tax=Loa loa TaxID=7209 RepID=A0A1I7VQB1_LOALO|nr:hypothetical protein LOAG_12161 [Loa loa]EFO16349.1 hypothetical protein LOAG_12161 [Loa loa]